MKKVGAVNTAPAFMRNAFSVSLALLPQGQAAYNAFLVSRKFTLCDSSRRR
jgi:hypothetical protein